MKRFDDFDGLALFLRVVEAGGLAPAERATGIPKATLSRRMSVLEERLLRRTRKGVVLTEPGRLLFERSRAAFSEAEGAVAEVQDEGTALSGTIRLSLPPDIAVAVLAPALIRFKAGHPAVIVELTLADRRVSLVEEGYDLVVRMGPVEDSDLMSRRIATLPRMLVTAPAFLAAHPGLRGPGDLEALPALAIRRDLVRWELRHPDGTAATVRPGIGFAANRQTILVEAAVAGLGIANLPAFLIAEEMRRGALVRVLPEWEPAPVEMTALWQKDRITGRLIQAILAEFALLLRKGLG